MTKNKTVIVGKGGFQKADGAKNMLELIQPEYVEGLGRILTGGAIKYAPNNWKKANNPEGIERVKGAMLRHTYAYLRGEKLDPDTNESHLYHISCNLMFLDYCERNPYKKKKRKKKNAKRNKKL